MSMPAEQIAYLPAREPRLRIIRQDSGSTSSSDASPELARALREALSRHMVDFSQGIQGVIEEQIAKSASKWLTQISSQESGPFDAVYIAQLRMDRIDPRDQQQIASFWTIRDRSEELTFNDGLDDD
jgi:hypothetical protein